MPINLIQQFNYFHLLICDHYNIDFYLLYANCLIQMLLPGIERSDCFPFKCEPMADGTIIIHISINLDICCNLDV